MASIPTPEWVALVRRRYRDGATLRAIAAESGIRNGKTIYRCLAGEFPDGSGTRPAPIPRRRTGGRRRGGGDSRTVLVERIWRTAEKQVEDIEQRLETAGLALAERESNARTLATLVKTLRELTAFDQAQKPRGREAPDHNDDDAVPRNIEDLRQSLARKLEAFAAGVADQVPGKSG